MVSNTQPYIFGTSGTAITNNNIVATNVTTSFTIDEQSIKMYKFPPKYWWKFTHYECPLCGTVDTVRERIYVKDQPKPENDEDRHIDKEVICGYHFT